MTGPELTLARSILDEPLTVTADIPAMLPIFALRHESHRLVPDACSVLSRWPTGLRSAQLLATGLLDLPRSVLGAPAARNKTPNDLVGLAMYASSREAQCEYSAAHASAYAIRRGLHPAAIAGRRLPREQTTAEFAEALVAGSAQHLVAATTNLEEHLNPQEVAAIALAVGFAGFVNKFSRAMGLELEPEVADEVVDLRLHSADGRARNRAPTDMWRTALRLARATPATAALERRWLSGVPSRAPQAVRYLERTTGVSFDILPHLPTRRAMRSVATVVRDNLTGSESTVDRQAKALAALVFATLNDAGTLASQAQRAVIHGDSTTSVDLFEAVRIFAHESPTTTDTFMLDRWLDRRTIDVLLLARAISPPPALVAPEIVDRVRTSLSASDVVEVVVWLSVQQMLARLERSFSPRSARPCNANDYDGEPTR